MTALPPMNVGPPCPVCGGPWPWLWLRNEAGEMVDCTHDVTFRPPERLTPEEAMSRLSAWQVDRVVQSFDDAQVDAIIDRARIDAIQALRSGDEVWRHAAPNAKSMLAILARIDKLELAAGVTNGT